MRPVPVPAGYVVRDAGPDDAERWAVVHVRIWQEAYAGLLPADYLAGLDDTLRSGRRVDIVRERLAAPAPGVVNLLAETGGAVVGLCTAGPSRDDPPDPPDELYAVNVLAAHHGTGVSGALFDTALARTAGDRAASLWVLDGNDRAQAFYRRRGFAPDGRRSTYGPTGSPEGRWTRPAGWAPSAPR